MVTDVTNEFGYSHLQADIIYITTFKKSIIKTLLWVYAQCLDNHPKRSHSKKTFRLWDDETFLPSANCVKFIWCPWTLWRGKLLRGRNWWGKRPKVHWHPGQYWHQSRESDMEKAFLSTDWCIGSFRFQTSGGPNFRRTSSDFRHSLMVHSQASKVRHLSVRISTKHLNKRLITPCFPSQTQCLKITQNVTFQFCHFPPIFDLLKLTCLVTLFDRKL